MKPIFYLTFMKRLIYSLIELAAGGCVQLLVFFLEWQMGRRAAVFIYGSNFYMNLRNVGIKKGDFDYAGFLQRLIGSRDWVGTFFYIAPVRPGDHPKMAQEQQRFFSHLGKTKNVTLKLGVLEERFEECEKCGSKTRSIIQKGVDVLLTGDMIAMAMQDKYDDGYLVSADADYVPLAKYLRFNLKKKGFCVSPKGARYGKLAKACNSAIPIDQKFIDECQAV